jgi:hypothetical protein
MKIFIKHRLNSISEISDAKPSWGAEIDLRSDLLTPGKIHLSHDPWKAGDDFEKWLERFVEQGIQGPLILNTKEDGLEERAQELMIHFGIKNYFFLDTAIPTLLRWSKGRGLKNFAVRFSIYESEYLALEFASCVDWVWLDCFEGRLPSVASVEKLKEYFKICLVSPELQRIAEPNWGMFLDYASISDAICTKNPEEWTSRGIC